MSNKMILVVDDEQMYLEMIAKILEEEGYQVIKSSDAKLAMELIHTHRMGLSAILMDLISPTYDGYIAIKTIKSQGLLRMIPIMALSPTHDKESVIKAMQAGADDFLTKPFDTDELLSRVHILCRISDFIKKWK